MRNVVRFARCAFGLALTGAVFQIAGCSLGGAQNFLSQLNPCGTILVCDPVEFRFLTSGYRGPGANPDIDPACTFPPFCAGDPFVSSGNQP